MPSQGPQPRKSAPYCGVPGEKVGEDEELPSLVTMRKRSSPEKEQQNGAGFYEDGLCGRGLEDTGYGWEGARPYTFQNFSDNKIPFVIDVVVYVVNEWAARS
ncbi:hypothetical protein BOTCAL_0342g00050 [Botryotinia calthae]|uniref:Uncharacterized protein n=1 Tax=Botryotinia calthae TaxID=38488 RepID=A0A4Y8CTJ5_9HELO|nr:hypothetical protein BOTCAL_0342g00050 [Botryotinia calthae]